MHTFCLSELNYGAATRAHKISRPYCFYPFFNIGQFAADASGLIGKMRGIGFRRRAAKAHL